MKNDTTETLKENIRRYELALAQCKDGFLHTLCRLDLNRMRKQLEAAT